MAATTFSKLSALAVMFIILPLHAKSPSFSKYDHWYKKRKSHGSLVLLRLVLACEAKLSSANENKV